MPESTTHRLEARHGVYALIVFGWICGIIAIFAEYFGRNEFEDKTIGDLIMNLSFYGVGTGIVGAFALGFYLSVRNG